MTDVDAADPWPVAREAAEALGRHDVAVVLGSGWVPAAAAFGPGEERPMAGLPGFVTSTVVGHGGALRSVDVGGRRVLLLLGRVHLYEGHPAARVVHGLRAAVLAGCSTVVLTNAAGGLRPGMQVGQAVLISDHLNLQGVSPLAGPVAPAPHDVRFVDLTEAWSGRLRALAREVDASLEEGVYAGLPGPHYETPAEIRMLRTLGADLVGMSTVQEVIAARHLGAEVLGVSLVTNLAAGLSPAPLSHEEVVAAGRASAQRVGRLLVEVIGRL